MPILGRLLKQGIKLRKSIEQDRRTPSQLQMKQLIHLLQMAKSTRLGETYHFEEILKVYQQSGKASAAYAYFKQNVPLSSYKKMYQDWWHLSREGYKDIAWPGLIEYFALSSGTSESSSKYIPVTRDMIKAIHRTSIRQILSLSNFKELPSKIYGKGMLMLGGSTHLNRRGTYFEGDLSGITASQIPFWFQHFYKPGRRIAKNIDWDQKLDEIVLKAPKWDIGFVVGVPAWIQILMEKIIDHYQLDHIHEIWPNLMVYAHGGVSFEPYKKGFEKLLGRSITYIETYLASEGFIAFQTHPNQNMRMVLNNGIFYEFVPFNSHNFTVEGELKDQAETLLIDEVNPNQDYALIMSTCAGAWRYLIGDTIRFTSLEKSEIIITGRTKHFLSLCGEHLSVDNMNKALELVADELNMNVKEFTVVGIPHSSLFAHQWYIGTDDLVDEEVLSVRIDEILKEINDDYRVERSAALQAIYVKTLPTQVFYQWMEHKGKVGGQNKFPRVLKKEQHDEWLNFIHEKSN